MGDTLSIKVYQAVAAALQLNPGRSVILSDTGNFPSDLYMVQGLAQSLERKVELRLVEPSEVADALDDSVAALMLTEVDYRTGRLHDMKSLTSRAHEMGGLTIWDLAHSAGALPVDVSGCDADFAVGCSYKYLNGGPGAPAFIYVAPRLIDDVRPALSGWLGHAAPFDFNVDYQAGAGIERMRVGTPPVLGLRALEASLDIWDQVSIHDVRAESMRLGDLFIELVKAACPQLALVSPQDAKERGSQVSFSFDEGYALMQALIEAGVIGDFRAPNIVRFGITPLYVGEDDVREAASRMAGILAERTWDQPRFRVRRTVT
jgi:kynureninase